MVSTLINFNESRDILWLINIKRTIRKSRRIPFVRARMSFVAVTAFIVFSQPIEWFFEMLSESLESLFAAVPEYVWPRQYLNLNVNFVVFFF